MKHACYLRVANGFKGAEAGSNPHTHATTTLISNKYVAYRWLLSFTPNMRYNEPHC
jgi:hypothetical protein